MCTQEPASIGAMAAPIGHPYLRTSRTLRNSPQRDLMSRWNVLPCIEGSLANLRALAAHEGDWRHGDVIQWIKAQQARKSAGIVVAHQVSG